MHADLGFRVKQYANSGYCRNVLFAFKPFLSSLHFQFSNVFFFLVFDMASDNENVAATYTAFKKGGSTSATNRFVLCEPAPHCDVARSMRLYPSMLNSWRF